MTDPTPSPETTYTGTVSTQDGKIASVLVITSPPTDQPPPVLPALPDLQITALRVVSPSPGPDGKYPNGAPLLMGCKVKNTGRDIPAGTIIGVAHFFGNAQAVHPYTWTDTFTAGLKTNEETPELVANGGFNGSTFPAVGPQLTIVAHVDDTASLDRIPEMNEANNTMTMVIDVADPVTPPIPVPPTPGKKADPKATVGWFPGDGPEAEQIMKNMESQLRHPLAALANNIGGANANEYASRSWGIANPVSAGGQGWIGSGGRRRLALTLPFALPGPGVAYYPSSPAQKRQAVLDFASGKMDYLINQLAGYVNAGGGAGQCDFRIMSEPDATWYWASIDAGIDALQQAARHCVPLLRSKMPGCRIVFGMNGACDRNMAWSPVTYGSGLSQTELIWGAIKDLRPDLVADDIYYSGSQGKDEAFKDVERKMTFLKAWSDDWKVPACVPEWGLDGVDWPDAIDHWKALVEKFADGQFLYHNYFGNWQNASLNTKPQTKAKFFSSAGFGT